MTSEPDYRRVLPAYPGDCQPREVEFLAAAGGFSGARFWRLRTARGLLCLRRWPPEHPTLERLQFIQAVLWHVHQEGFNRVPLPLETLRQAGFVQNGGHFWELTPWFPGQPTYHAAPSEQKLQAAMVTLAQFHRAAASFPLPEGGCVASPGIGQRLEQLERMLAGQAQQLAAEINADHWPELAERARALLKLFPVAAPGVLSQLREAAALRVVLQPCIRDIWHDHVLFEGEHVSALIDFGAMRPENVAADVARLLGSLAGDDEQTWRDGLSAYQALRPLSSDERRLVSAFDRSTVLMAGLNWLTWIYQQGREFSNHAAILERLDLNLQRLAELARC